MRDEMEQDAFHPCLLTDRIDVIGCIVRLRHVRGVTLL